MWTNDHEGYCPCCDRETDQQSWNDNDDTGTHTTCLECEQDVDTWFMETAFEIAFGDDAINRDFSQREVINELWKFSELAAKYEDLKEQCASFGIKNVD